MGYYYQLCLKTMAGQLGQANL